eukprot:5954219-Prymnesium_polylepis.1
MSRTYVIRAVHPTAQGRRRQHRCGLHKNQGPCCRRWCRPNARRLLPHCPHNVPPRLRCHRAALTQRVGDWPGRAVCAVAVEKTALCRKPSRPFPLRRRSSASPPTPRAAQ